MRLPHDGTAAHLALRVCSRSTAEERDMNVNDPVFRRIRAACCDIASKEIDVDSHARYVTSIVLKAKRTKPRWKLTTSGWRSGSIL